MIYHEGFRVTGSVNTTIFDAGITSTEKEKKRLVSILAQVSDYLDDDIEVWVEKAKIASIPDKLIDTIKGTGSANNQYAGARINEIPIDIVIETGQVVRAAVKSGALAINLVGCYVYEIVALA